MSDFDVGRIVPSMRDLFGALATRRRSLALIATLDDAGSPSEAEARRLEGIDLRAFAVAVAGDGMLTAARSTETTPLLCCTPATSVDDCLRARFFGADGIAIGADDAEGWLEVAKAARSMHMLALGHASSAVQVQMLVDAGARAIMVAAPSVADAIAWAEPLPTSTTVVAHGLDGGFDDAALRTLAGKVDAALVPSRIHRAPSFVELLDELDG